MATSQLRHPAQLPQASHRLTLKVRHAIRSLIEFRGPVRSCGVCTHGPRAIKPRGKLGHPPSNITNRFRPIEHRAAHLNL